MKFGIVVFPGSNCDHDAYFALKHNLGFETQFLWHKDTNIPSDIKCIVLPGGFSYGDYLRTGAIARFSPIMKEVVRFANNGGLVIGICNGFQILTESGLLPGALLKNTSLRFICRDVFLKTLNTNTPFTSLIEKDRILKIPIAHFEGNYFADDDTLKELEDNGQIVFQYSTPDGEVTQEANPNGSLKNIAGITNKDKNVLGMMPHPERYCDPILGGIDGSLIFKSIANFLK
ncbi:phosphoribosylformylglycinamidine synthase subunit PurQ [Bacteroidetes/Chlorobi group bacterium MS-B_bin-24]|jgi:phosphoribosylformylglycinamidine synthase|nr:MAG: phosphoribosylformylglycinamidine synthase subunit PurQ [Bacteroidetes/Chlorobi group bacterium MS-B_bin-24]